MVRISDIAAPADFLLEERREVLRNDRCQRRCEAVIKVTNAIRSLLGAIVLALTALHLSGVI